MSLPDLIEIKPLTGPVRAEVTVPGSKSITNRALVLAALAEGETMLRGALWSEDTQVMVDCLQALGFMVNVSLDPHECANRTITVYGRGGEVPRGGTDAQPLDLYVGNAGTAARFLTALVCLGQGVYRLQGVPRMHQRPQGALLAALRELGYRVEAAADRLPVLVHGGGRRAGRCRVSITESSQFASALLLGARAGGWEVEVTGENAEESPYVAMTVKMTAAFGRSGGRFEVEPDASSGSYFWGADRLLAAGSSVRVRNWPSSGWQVDEAFPRFLGFPGSISRRGDLGDSIMTAIVLVPVCAAGPVEFTDLGRLRLQECERVTALRTELIRCGARVQEEEDRLVVSPAVGGLHGALIQTYHDHRMAMCFSILGLKVPGLKIQNPACVKKTFPNFYQKLAALPPSGLGATIVEVETGRVLSEEDLFAE